MLALRRIRKYRAFFIAFVVVGDYLTMSCPVYLCVCTDPRQIHTRRTCKHDLSSVICVLRRTSRRRFRSLVFSSTSWITPGMCDPTCAPVKNGDKKINPYIETPTTWYTACAVGPPPLPRTNSLGHYFIYNNNIQRRHASCTGGVLAERQQASGQNKKTNTNCNRFFYWLHIAIVVVIVDGNGWRELGEVVTARDGRTGNTAILIYTRVRTDTDCCSWKRRIR